MRIDNVSSHSFPIKRKPRRGSVQIDEHVEDVEIDVDAQIQAAEARAKSAGNLPVRQQDMIFPRSISRRAAQALGSYLTTATFVDWDMEVLGLDLHI